MGQTWSPSSRTWLLSCHWGQNKIFIAWNSEEILKVSHFLLLFSVGEKTNESKHF